MPFKQNLCVCGADTTHWVRQDFDKSQLLSLTFKFVPQDEHNIVPVLLGLNNTET